MTSTTLPSRPRAARGSAAPPSRSSRTRQTRRRDRRGARCRACRRATEKVSLLATSSTHSEATAGLSRVMIMKKGPKRGVRIRRGGATRTNEVRYDIVSLHRTSRRIRACLDYGSDRPPRRESVCGVDERGGEKRSARLGERAARTFTKKQNENQTRAFFFARYRSRVSESMVTYRIHTVCSGKFLG